MTYQTHVAGGLAAGAGLLLYLHSPGSAVLPVLAIAGVASVISDVDHRGSLVNHVPVAGLGGKVVSAVVAHRSVTHSLLAMAALMLGLMTLQVPIVYVYAAGAGVFSHLALDSLNPQGVPWIWPVKIKFKIPLVTTGHFAEKLIVMPACYLLAGYFVVRYFGIL